ALTKSVTVRTSLSATNLEPQIRREIQAVDPELPVFNVRTMNEVIDGSLASRRFSAELVGVLPWWRFYWRRWGYTVCWPTWSVNGRTRLESGWRWEPCLRPLGK